MHVQRGGSARGQLLRDTPRVLGCRLEFFGALNRRTLRPVGPIIYPSRGWSAANRSLSGGGLSHVAGHKSNRLIVLLAAAAVGQLCRDKVCALLLGNELETPSNIVDAIRGRLKTRAREGAQGCRLTTLT